MAGIGRLVQFTDEASHAFTFAICPRCNARLLRLPTPQQYKQMGACVGILARHPDRYDVKPFESEIDARAFVVLESERLRGDLVERHTQPTASKAMMMSGKL